MSSDRTSQKFKDKYLTKGKTLESIIAAACACCSIGLALHSGDLIPKSVIAVHPDPTGAVVTYISPENADKYAHFFLGIGGAALANVIGKAKYKLCFALPIAWEVFEGITGFGVFDTNDMVWTWIGSAFYMGGKKMVTGSWQDLKSAYEKLVSAKNTLYAGAAYVKDSTAAFASLFL